MAKEIVTRVWCDLCQGRDAAEPATHTNVTFMVGTGRSARPRSLDLCDTDYKEVVEPLLEALEEYGAPVDLEDVVRPRKPHKPAVYDPIPGPFICQVGGCESRPLKNSSSLASHARGTHDMGFTEYKKNYGPLRASHESESSEQLFPSSEPIGESEAVCEVEGCGKVYSHALGNNRPAQALGVHMARTHQVKSSKKA